MVPKAQKKGGRVLRLARISHTRLASLDRDHTMVVATLSPIEVHVHSFPALRLRVARRAAGASRHLLP